VPGRWAEGELHSAICQLREVGNERDGLKEGIERAVQQHIGQVIAERDVLRREVQSLKRQAEATAVELKANTVSRKELVRLRGELIRYQATGAAGWGEVEQAFESTLSEFRNQFYPHVPARGRLWSSLSATLVFYPAIGIASWFYLTHRPLSWMVVLELFGATLASLAAREFSRHERSFMNSLKPYMQLESQIRRILGEFRRTAVGAEAAHEVEVDQPPIPKGRMGIIISDFLRMTRALPPTLNEELTYRLMMDLGEMPPSLARKYTEDIAERYTLNPANRQRLARVIERIVILRPNERRVVLDQLRRAQLS